jgi:uncharacterized protein (DUF885 family)
MLCGAASGDRRCAAVGSVTKAGGVGELTTAREALLAEALGEVARLAERLEAVAPALDASREAIVRSGENLAGQVGAFETRMVTITENAKTVAVRHIAQRTDELVRSAGEAQVRAMQSAAMALFRDEVHPALQRLAASLQQQPRPSRVERWWSHAAVAIVASALSWAMAAWLWAR